MSNLLPAIDRERVHELYRARRRRVALNLLGAWLTLALIILAALGGWLHRERVKLVAARPLNDRLADGSNLSDLEQTLARFRNHLVALERGLNGPPPPSAAIAAAVAARPAGLRLTQFQYQLEKNGPVLTIEGQAATRSGLLTFIDKLKASPEFAAVQSPIANLVRSNAVPFTLTLTLAKTGSAAN